MATRQNPDRALQLRRIWGTANELGMDSDTLHAFLHKQIGKDSFRRCTDRQLEIVANGLRYVMHREESQRGRATAKQKSYIRDLEEAIGWADQPDRLRGFIRKMYNVESLDWLTVAQASDLIEALKSFLRRAEPPKGGNRHEQINS